MTALALGRGRSLLGHGPHIVPWQECRQLFEPGPLAEQLTSLREMAPADLATAIETLPQARRSQLAAALDDEELADLLEEMPEQDQIRLLDSLEIERSADVVEEMQPDDAADLLGEMPARAARTAPRGDAVRCRRPTCAACSATTSPRRAA